ncbi:MAG: AarF/ABC1/UbiB kinase family protein [Gemmatimonadaceae bacterium]|nr:AarF/ABC1/UbiB kinase family protein [Gemmatimonadaceae bacterium]
MILAPRYLPRLAATIGLFTRYGLRDFARRQGLQGIAPDPAEAEEGEESSDAREQAIAFRRRLVELGPAYIKLGQVLSTRPDLLPAIYVEELEQLQDDVDPVPFAIVSATVEKELQGRLSKLFASFDEEPLGTASLGQVHAAELRNGRSVVVKVQRPGIRAQLADDVEFFRELATFLAAHSRAGARVDLVGVIQQLERALADELDYRIEARNAASMRRSLATYPRLLIPKVIEGYTTEKVLTTERIRGVKISEISPLTRLDYDFRPVAEEIVRAYLQQITIDGHFHADPHPGNIFVVLPGTENPWTPSETVANNRRSVTRTAHTPLAIVEEKAREEAAPLPVDLDVKLSLIDFGMTARLSSELKEGVIRLLTAIADNRGDEAAGTMVEMGDPIEDFDRTAYQREIAALIGRNYDLSIGEVQAGEVMYELINASYQHGLRMPAELTLLAKTLFNLDAVGRSLDPTFSPIETIREFGDRLVTERARQEFSPRRMLQAAAEAGDLIASLPHRIDLISTRLANNEFAVRVDTPQIESLLSGLQKVANRIFSGLILAGLLVASAMLMPHRRSLGTIGFWIAGGLGVYMVLTIWFNDRKRR